MSNEMTMKTEHHVYCKDCSQSILKKWKGWRLRKVIPMLPRMFDGTCEACGGREELEASRIAWLNYHSEYNTGLSNYWLLVISQQQNNWGEPYYCESKCPRCNGRSIVSKISYSNGTEETCHNCNDCGVIKS
jgi:hypothetical protein